MLNRGALIVRPKQPFIDWAAGLDGSGIVPDPASEQTVYLVPEFSDDTEAEELLRAVAGEIFARELWGWHTDEADWPAVRDFDTFLAWFQVELHSVVEDVVADVLVDDDDDGDAADDTADE